jgi:hypothetical protein
MPSLPHFPTTNDVFIETTEISHGHGGPGWEFGTCLWSPTLNRAGHDAYVLMRSPLPNDLVLHILKDHSVGEKQGTHIVGHSIVRSPATVEDTEPPSPGAWAGMPHYYRIELRGYTPFEIAVPLDIFLQDFEAEIRTEIESAHPRYYPFTLNAGVLRLNQGQYLTRCTPMLFQHIEAVLEIDSQLPASGQTGEDNSPAHEFSEGRRMSAERQFFARNPALTDAAKKKYGFVCQICKFDFGRAYGPLGEGYIEAHHLSPLSERNPSTWTEKLRTSVDQVRVLCANCHRMIHRRRPALSIEDVRRALRT